jgi:dimeric dUTPase (all-alpha-NTP-PPase superfamily)
MILKELFNTQKKLDETIIKNHNLEGKDLFSKKIVAFVVEMSELANEIRFMKYWSNKEKSSQEVILEEYVDAFHFLLSIGNEISCIYKLDKTIENFDYQMYLNYSDFTDNFIEIIREICKLEYYLDCKMMSLQLYIEIMNMFLGWGNKLGFGFKEIETGYYKKNEINFKRQESNY